MTQESAIKIFEQRNIRTHWDTEQEKWHFSIVDVVGVLTDQPDIQGARNYWKVLKHRLKAEGIPIIRDKYMHVCPQYYPRIIQSLS